MWNETIDAHALTFLSHIILASAGVLGIQPWTQVISAFQLKSHIFINQKKIFDL